MQGEQEDKLSHHSPSLFVLEINRMPSHPHCHWRTTKEWKDLDLEMSTTSDEACKMFDATLTQLVSRHNDVSLGGLEFCMEKMMVADPDFVLGHVIQLGADAMSGKTVYNDSKYAQNVYKMIALADQPHVKPWERRHASAVKLFAEGNMDLALSEWEDILVDHPLDILSLKFSHDIFGFTGYGKRTRDICARVLPYWKPDIPFYGDILSMHAFGLEESNLYIEAENTARKALEMNLHDGWATHCIAHCKEMTGKYQEGIQFMSDTEDNWNGTSLSCHNYWHLSLFYLEVGDFESAIEILDNRILPDMKKGRSLNSMSDAASLGFRLEAEGHNLGAKWNDCYDIAKYHEKDCVWSYWDISALLTCIGANKKDDIGNIIRRIKYFIQNGHGDNRSIYQDVALPVLEAVRAYGDQDYDTAVELMKPVRPHIDKIGGSTAQRDLLNIFTTHAALQSKVPKHQKYATQLLMERKALKGETPLVERLLQRAVQSH